MAVQSSPVEPLIPILTTIQQPTITHDWVDHTQISTQPGLALVLSINRRVDQFRLTITQDTHPGIRNITRPGCPQQDSNLTAKFGSWLGDIQCRAIMMRL